MKRDPPEEHVDLLAQILAEEDVLSGTVIAAFCKRPMSDRLILIEGLFESLDDYRRREVWRRYNQIVAVQEGVFRRTAENDRR